MKKKTIFALLCVPLLVAAVIFCTHLAKKAQTSLLTGRTDRMVAHAQSLWDRGEKEVAMHQLYLYCERVPDNVEGYLLLGDWHRETGNDPAAFRHYKKAAQNMPCGENQIAESKKSLQVSSSVHDVSITIRPSVKLTQNMTLTISGQNVTPAGFQSGIISGTSLDLLDDPNYTTTEWFDIDSAQRNLVLSGRINLAVWQFIDSDGYVTHYADPNHFKKSSSWLFSEAVSSTVTIPEDAVRARVTFWDASAGEKYTDDIVIAYSAIPDGVTDLPTQVYAIPDLKDGEMIRYQNGIWQYFDGKTYHDLDWEAPKLEKGSRISVDGDLSGEVTLTGGFTSIAVGDKTRQYGIAFQVHSELSVGERLGDAAGMRFNYTVDGNWVGAYENDFDKAYPWCEMKLCCVTTNASGRQRVILEGQEGFATDGSAGNVMVRIPKFYCKRTVKNGREEIWISGTRYEGYEVDPVFLKDGQELDYVYVGAYLGAEENGKIVSHAGTYPTVNLTYGKTLQMAKSNGAGYSEINYLMYSALQRLFLVETGTRDSSSIFAGDTEMLYFLRYNAPETSAMAALDAQNTNTITLYNNYNTRLLTPGSSIAIGDDWSTYRNDTAIRREITAINRTNLYLEIVFDGEPIDVTRHKTTVANIPQLTGKTGTIDYCTGTLEGKDGTVSFKYRNIENLYGSALVMLDQDAYVADGYFYYHDGNGELVKLSTPVALQPKTLNSYDHVNVSSCVKTMSYDRNYPLVMMPTELGNGATVYNYYGDLWLYELSEEPRYFVVGGANYNARVSGLFQMRPVLTGPESYLNFYSARIMYR